MAGKSAQLPVAAHHSPAPGHPAICIPGTTDFVTNIDTPLLEQVGDVVQYEVD